jgi:hypothetical protein
MAATRSSPRQAILLSGMYRSGTAAASRALSFLGFAQPRLLVEAGPANPKGFWEASRIAETNAAMLGSLGWSWDKTPLLIEPGQSPEETQADVMAFLKDRWLAPARQAIAESYRSDAKNVICKDPLLSLFPAFWQAAFEAEGFEVHHVLTFRHPLETAASLKRHRELGRTLALRAWLAYNLRPLTQVELEACIDYADLIAEPAGTVNAVAGKLGVSDLDPAAAEELRAFLDPADNHAPTSTPEDDARLPRLALDVLELLRDWRGGADVQLKRRARRMSRAFQDAELLFGRPQRLAVDLGHAPLAEAPLPPRPKGVVGKAQVRQLVLHYHLFKNAGTSVDEVLKGNFGDRWANAEFQVRRRQPNVHLIEQWLLDHPDVQALSSHTANFPLPRLEGLRVAPIIFVRHPLDRIHSAYEFERRQNADTPGAKLARESDFPTYVRGRLARSDNQCSEFQATRFAALPTEGGGTLADRALRAVDALPFVGLVEAFAPSMQRLEAVLRQTFPDFRAFGAKANVLRGKTLEERLEDIRRELGAELHAELIAANAADLALYEKVAAFYGVTPALAEAS